MTIVCPFCHNAVASHRFTAPLDCKTFRPTRFGAVYACSACSAGFVHPRPTPNETNAFYDLDAYYTQGRSHMPETGKPGFAAKVRCHLAWRADKGKSLAAVIASRLPAGSRITDIGCGGGGLLNLLGEMGYQMVGVERDATTVSRSSLAIQVLEGSAEQLPDELSAGSQDGVLFSHVIEHLVDPAEAIRSAAKLLKPGGLMFIEVPNNEASIARQSGPTWEHLDVPRHINFFCERSLHALVRTAGLSVSETYFCGYNRYFHDTYIATEQRIFDEFVKGGWRPTQAVRNSALRSWTLLAKTAFAPSRDKYDSIGVVAAH